MNNVAALLWEFYWPMKRTVFLLTNGPKKPSLKIFYAYAF